MQSIFKRALVITICPLVVSAVANLRAQTFSTLYRFTDGNGFGYANRDGYTPEAALSLSNNTIYGTTLYGGSAGAGAVFKVGIDGTGFANLHSFTALDDVNGTNIDGNAVYANLVISGEYLYGIASRGGNLGGGTLFKMRTDGSGFTNLYYFRPPSTTNTAVRTGPAALALSGNCLYGAWPSRGDFGVGMLFKIDLDGTGFTNLHSFSPASFSVHYGLQTNTEGMYPLGALILSGDTLYGTAAKGGAMGCGTVFKATTNGMAFTVLHSFSGWYDSADGDVPLGLLLAGTTLYGTAGSGGAFGNGTVFAVATDGNVFTNLHFFTANDSLTNQDGAGPSPGLVLAGDTLYGTTSHAGPSSAATVFRLNTNGTGFATVHGFAPGNFDISSTNMSQPFTNSEGMNPLSGLVASGDALYGTASFGGRGGGTVFRILFAPKLTFTHAKTQAILSWPTGYTGFGYADFRPQVTTNHDSTVWSQITQAPAIIDGSYTITSPISGTQQFYRLSH